MKVRHVLGDPKVLASIETADQRIHGLAPDLVSASPEQRSERYAELLLACADGHRQVQR